MPTKIKEFTYTDTKGKVSERVVYQLHPVSNKLLGIDLTEFSSVERDFYEEELKNLDMLISQSIKAMGLGSNYRNFLGEKICEKS